MFVVVVLPRICNVLDSVVPPVTLNVKPTDRASLVVSVFAEDLYILVSEPKEIPPEARVEVARDSIDIGFVVPIPICPAAVMVRPEEVALKAPPGVSLNLLESELSKPKSHALIALS